jgi:multisubunit Na+/H+ antiporter MnhB subunit
MPEEPKSAGDVISGLITDQLAQERALKASLEQRGFAVITTAGALVTLLFAISSVVWKPQASSLPGVAKAMFLVALVLFLIAAVFGLATNWPTRYSAISDEELQKRIQDRETWLDSAAAGAQTVGLTLMRLLVEMRDKNQRKARLLSAGMWTEVAAGGALALALGLMLWGAAPQGGG